MTVGLQDVDNETYRNAKGELIRDRVCGGANAKRKLTLSWYWLTQKEACQLLQSVKSEFFPVQYFDPYEGKVITKTMYAGDRSAPCYTRHNGEEGYKDTAFNLIEK